MRINDEKGDSKCRISELLVEGYKINAEEADILNCDVEVGIGKFNKVIKGAVKYTKS